MKNKLARFSWPEIGDAYQTFSVLCDEGDWQAIITQIAVSAATNANTSRRILDYGAGLGSTASSIRRKMYGNHGVLSSWVLYEPDEIARKAHQMFLPTLSSSMIAESLPSLPVNSSFDVVLFIHTSYYIADFDLEIDRLFNTCLKSETNAIICVSMPEESPFFISELDNWYPWTAQEICESVEKLGLRCEVSQLRSRFRWLPSMADDATLSELVSTFVCGRKQVSLGEIELVRSRLIGETDFGDWLIVVRR